MYCPNQGAAQTRGPPKKNCFLQADPKLAAAPVRHNKIKVSSSNKNSNFFCQNAERSLAEQAASTVHEIIYDGSMTSRLVALQSVPTAALVRDGWLVISISKLAF
jgi:hypothetical protein